MSPKGKLVAWMVSGEGERERGRLRHEGIGGCILGKGPCLAIRYCISLGWDLLLNFQSFLNASRSPRRKRKHRDYGRTSYPWFFMKRNTSHKGEDTSEHSNSVGPKALPLTGLSTLLLGANPRTFIKLKALFH